MHTNQFQTFLLSLTSLMAFSDEKLIRNGDKVSPYVVQSYIL